MGQLFLDCEPEHYDRFLEDLIFLEGRSMEIYSYTPFGNYECWEKNFEACEPRFYMKNKYEWISDSTIKSYKAKFSHDSTVGYFRGTYITKTENGWLPSNKKGKIKEEKINYNILYSESGTSDSLKILSGLIYNNGIDTFIYKEWTETRESNGQWNKRIYSIPSDCTITRSFELIGDTTIVVIETNSSLPDSLAPKVTIRDEFDSEDRVLKREISYGDMGRKKTIKIKRNTDNRIIRIDEIFVVGNGEINHNYDLIYYLE